MSEWKTPSSTKLLRRFIGIKSYYRKFIENYSQKTAPLTVLLKGKRVLKGNHKQFIPIKLN